MLVQGREYPDNFHYDMERQLWYEQLADGTVRAGYTAIAMDLIGEVMIFTPKRLGRDFEANRSFALIEGGKWVSAVCAPFAGTIVSANEAVEKRPALLNEDPMGAGWLAILRPAQADWHTVLLTGDTLGPAYADWIETTASKYHKG